MSFEIDFNKKIISINDSFNVNFNFKYLQFDNIKLKYIKPHWYLNLTTGEYQFYLVHPLRELDVKKPDFVISCELISERVKKFNSNIFKYLDILEEGIVINKERN